MSAIQEMLDESPAVLADAVEPDDLETIEDALAEITRRFVEADAARGRLRRRRDELLLDAHAARRKAARNHLDAFLPPVTFYSIEAVQPDGGAPPDSPIVPALTDEQRAGVEERTSYERRLGRVHVIDYRKVSPFDFRCQ